MYQWRRRIILSVVGVSAIILIYTLFYQWAMATLEGQERTFFDALQVVIESLTTAGFGGDTDYWTTNTVNAFVILMNLTGVLLVFLAIPIFGVPLFRQAFETPPPRSSDLENHVIICGHSPRDAVLSSELAEYDIPYLFIDSDQEIVRELAARDIDAMVGDPERVETFRSANIEAAQAVVADIDDETNPTIILAAKRANPHIRVLSVSRRIGVSEYHRYAGADEVIEAPRVLGESLGLRAVTSFAEKFREALGNGSEFELTELLIEEGSDLIGRTLRDVDLFEEHGIQIIGGWFGGKFLIPPPPDIEIAENTILLIGGTHEINAVETRKLPAHIDDFERVIVCGSGVVGQTAAGVISDHGISYDSIDIDSAANPDIVGDATEPETYHDANVTEARSVVLALDKDPKTVFATLVINNLAPDVEIIARVHNPENVWKLYSAGADFVLSMSVTSGEMLAAELIESQELLTPHDEFEVSRVSPGELAGVRLDEADVRSETGCTVVAIKRDETLITDVQPSFEFDSEDEVIIAGTESAIESFHKKFTR